MIKVKGGRRTPKYYYHKEQASKRLCSLLSMSLPKEKVEEDVVDISALILEIEFKIWSGLY